MSAPQRDEIETAVEFLQEKCSNLVLDNDKLFDEMTYLRKFLSSSKNEFFDKPTGE